MKRRCKEQPDENFTTENIIKIKTHWVGSKQNGENRGRKSVSLKIEQRKVPNINNTEKKK